MGLALVDRDARVDPGHSGSERDARYVAGYAAIPDEVDGDFKAIEQVAVEDLRNVAE